MFDSVILARDKWLAPGGLMLPSTARMFISPADESEAYEDKVTFWESFPKSVYGISMSSLTPLASKRFIEEVAVEHIAGQQCMSWPSKIFEMDCNTITSLELKTIVASFKCTSMVSNPAHSLAVWFEVEFPSSTSSSEKSPENLDAPRKKARLGKRLCASFASVYICLHLYCYFFCSHFN